MGIIWRSEPFTVSVILVGRMGFRPIWFMDGCALSGGWRMIVLLIKFGCFSTREDRGEEKTFYQLTRQTEVFLQTDFRNNWLG